MVFYSLTAGAPGFFNIPCAHKPKPRISYGTYLDYSELPLLWTFFFLKCARTRKLFWTLGGFDRRPLGLKF